MLAGYQLIERPSPAAGALICRARRPQDDSPAWLIWPDPETNALYRGSDLRRDFELLRSLDIPGLAKPSALIGENEGAVIVVPDCTGVPLEELMRRGRLALTDTLAIAVRLTDVLAALHAKGIMHGRIRPAHILVDVASGDLCWLTLHLAGKLAPAIDFGRLPAADLAYISPEQTGRINRAVDHRTDLYSLGIVLYRLLTGQLPFAAADPTELVHSHIARQPQPPVDLVEGVPTVLSRIVMKLLAKAAEDRYQSAAGLRYDLENCLAQVRSTGKIGRFPLGRKDVTEHFRVPDTLLGRDNEVALLRDAFLRVAKTGQSEVVLVEGDPGIGKSSLVQELRQTVAVGDAYFIAGKFDQYRHEVPYATITEAFRELVRQVLAEPEPRLVAWREKLLAALGRKARLIVELIPELELIVGATPSVPELPPAEAQNRFRRVFRQFVAAFARPEHPLVFFLDDLQWLDAGTLALMEELVTHPDTRFLLAIGAFRQSDAENRNVGRHDGCNAVRVESIVTRITTAGAKVNRITLGPLEREALTCLAADTLHCDRARAAPLARLLMEKTHGNPFFFIQFLTELHQERLLRFNAEKRAWTWELARIESKAHTDNVVDLMIRKLKRLPERTRQTLQFAACLGGAFTPDLLARIAVHPQEEIEAALQEATDEGLLRCRDGSCTFLQDRVQEVAYALLPAEQRPALHLATGRLLQDRLSGDAMAKQVFDVVDHLNRGASLISEPSERAHLADLNALAGRKAKAAIAYHSACAYFAQSLAWLPEDAWNRRYSETFAIHLDFAECEYLAGNFVRADELFNVLLAKAGSDLDRARACRIRSRLYQMTARFDDAIALLFQALRLFGVEMPDSEPQLQAATQRELAEIAGRLAGQPVAALAGRPQNADPVGQMIVSLLVEALGPSYAAKSEVFSLLAAKGVNASLRYGNSVESCVAYDAYALVLIAVRRDIEAAFEFSRMALDLIDRFGDPRPRGLLLVGHGGMVSPWRRHFEVGLPFVERGLAELLDVGDFLNAAYSSMFPVWNVFEQGKPLDEVVQAAGKYGRLAREVHHQMAQDTVRLCERMAASLKGTTSPPASLDGDGFSEGACLARFARNGWRVGIAYCNVIKQIVAFHYGQYGEALRAAEGAHDVLRHMMAMPLAASFCYYQTLTLAALYPDAAGEQDAFAGRMAKNLARLEAWAEHCPENFRHRHALAAAEAARLQGRHLDAMRGYEAAIAAAREQGFVHHEALACELAGRYYRSQGLARLADLYLTRARGSYLRWGADGKVREIDAAYPQLGSQEWSIAKGQPLDALAIMTAMRAISGEVVLDRLLATLMRIVIENAGAQSGCLMLRRGDEMTQVAAASVDDGRQVQVNASAEATDSHPDVPWSIVNYVRRTREKVILKDAAAANRFSADDYFVRQRPLSVLCLPILRHAELVGLLYLENRLVTHAFTPDRLIVVELLASQAATSLDNAWLYAGLQQEVAERRRAEESLRESRAMFQNLFESAPDAILVVEADSGSIVRCNRQAEALFGYAPDELPGQRIEILLPERFRQRHPQFRTAYVNHPHRRPMGTGLELYGLRKDGTEFPVDVTLGLLEATQGRLALSIVRDMSERKQAETERQARQAAEAASLAKSEFLANMSHELRSPLNTILGFARLMASDPALPGSARDDLDLILKSGEHLYALINQVLDLSKLEAGKATFNAADFDLHLLLDDLRNLFAPAASGKGLQLFFARHRKVPKQVRGDPLKLRQVLINLIDNALKFTSHGGVSVGVGVIDLPPAEAPAADLLGLRFTVSDSGPGIAPLELKSLFESFAQAEVGRQAQRGSGLGLTISRGFVQLMGGEIRMESEVGKGTTVCFDLPVRRVAQTAPEGEARFRRVLTLAHGQPRYRILVVDDQAEARELLVRWLAPLGFRVKEAADGYAAIEAWNQGHPDLVCLDLSMPGIDGFETSRRIRSSPRGQDAVILAVTAGAGEQERAAALAAGCNDLLRKPLREADLIAAVEKYLNVRFIYEEEAPMSPPALDAPALAALPAVQRDALEAALVRLDSDAVERTIEAIGGSDPGLARALAARAKDFQYDSILSALHGETGVEPEAGNRVDHAAPSGAAGTA